MVATITKLHQILLMDTILLGLIVIRTRMAAIPMAEAQAIQVTRVVESKVQL